MATPNSDLDVISTVGLVLDEFITMLEHELPKTNYVYDENLTYESAIAKLRADNEFKNIANPASPLPLFIFRRSVLRHSDKGAGRRVVTKKVLRKISNTESFYYTPLHGAFDVDFIYVTKDIVELERFEISYLTQKSFSEVKTIIVETLDFDPITYHIIYEEPLGEKIFNTVDNYYKAITGVFTIEGMYFLFEGKAKHISSILSKVREFNDKVLIDNTIV